MLNIHLLKFLDRWLGTALVRLFSDPRQLPPPAVPRSILLIRPGGIGDAVLLIPAIRTLQQRFPQATIDLLAEHRNAGAFALRPGIGRVYRYDRPGELLAVMRRGYDVVIDSEQWHRLSAVVARLVRAPVKIGFATNERARLFTHPIPYRLDDYEGASFMRLLHPFGIDATAIPDRAWLQPPESARRSVADLLPDDASLPLIVIFPGASIPEKLWAVDRFTALVQWCNTQSFRAVLVGGGGEREVAERVAAEADAINLAGSTSLAETAAILVRAAVVVSGDSGVLHMAVGLGRPTISLFGPSSAIKWGPRGGRHIVLRPTDCPACSRYGYTPPCSHQVRCMREVSVKDVTNAISVLLLE